MPIELILLGLLGIYLISNMVVCIGTLYAGIVQEGDRPHPLDVLVMIVLFLLAGTIIAVYVLTQPED